jgi:hypothetical protein
MNLQENRQRFMKTLYNLYICQKFTIQSMTGGLQPIFLFDMENF